MSHIISLSFLNYFEGRKNVKNSPYKLIVTDDLRIYRETRNLHPSRTFVGPYKNKKLKPGTLLGP